MSIEDLDRLKRNNQELLEIINNSWDGIGIIDKNTKFIYVNNAFMPILGFLKEELLDKPFTLLMEKKYQKTFLKLLDIKNPKKKYKAETDIVCIRKDKKRVYLRITISSMLNKNLFVINTKDITSQFSDDEILDDYVISMHTDLHGHITKISTAFLTLTGFNKEEVIGKTFSSFAHEDTNKIIYENMNKSLQNFQEWNGKLKKRKKDGSAFWINIKTKPIFNKYGDVTGYTSFMFDISKEISLNDESSMLQNQISKAKEEIDEKDKLLIQQSKLAIVSETLQKLSHEWRQPLNLISIQAQKLELDYTMNETPKLEDTVQTLENIKEEADKLSETIESFQKFLEPKNNKIKTSSKTIINKCLKNLIEELKTLDISLELDLEEDFQFFSYEEEIVNVLNNIITNAKEVIVSKNIEKGQIFISQYHEDEKVVFEIKDNAKGIKEEILHKIFEPYFSTKEKKHGVGLGLYMSKMIVNLHLKGVLTATNNEKGASFKLSIPIEENK